MPFNHYPLRILIAPNAFKNSLPADEVAKALADGLQESNCNAWMYCHPVGDGGDGTGKMLALHLGARKQLYKTFDPLGRPITAPVYYTADSTAIIELSDASGIKLLHRKEYAPLAASTFGTGVLIKKALNRKVKRIWLAIGGSATIDGGSGILAALGITFLNKEGSPIPALPGALSDLDRIDDSNLDGRLKQTEIMILCDVGSRLLGAGGAASVFGPQKGATQQNILQLEAMLKRLDNAIQKICNIKISALAFSGAAGGVAGSMAALCGAKAVNGIDFFLDATGFNQQLQQTNLVITGEGSLDAQTLKGKAPLGVAKRAKAVGIRVIGVAGQLDTGNEKLSGYFSQLININPPQTSLARALKNTKPNLVKAGRKIGRLLRTASG